MIHFLFPFSDFVWILQQEEYDSGRYLGWMKRFFFRRGFLKTGKLVYTLRAQLTLGVAKLLFILKLVGWYVLFGFKIAIILVPLALVFIPLFVLVAHLLLLPFILYAHAQVRTRASTLVKRHTGLKIIGIAGSYGKTSTKNFVYDLVRHRYKTQMIEGNINTLTGISQWILHTLAPETELLVMEMDAYKPGEIKATCAITPPDIAVLTTVGEQHMERFRSTQRLYATLGEIRLCLKPGGVFIADKKSIEAIGALDSPVDTSTLTYENEPVTAIGLSESNKENLARALKVAEVLTVPRNYIVDACTHLTIADRRQKPGYVLGYEGIDDSYNITLSTASAGLKTARALANAKGKKLLVLSAGITELGPDQKEGNVQLGEAFVQYAHQAVVLKTMFARDIEKGIDSKIPLQFYPRLEDFITESHNTFPPNEWFLLLQPTLNDLYYS